MHTNLSRQGGGQALCALRIYIYIYIYTNVLVRVWGPRLRFWSFQLRGPWARAHWPNIHDVVKQVAKQEHIIKQMQKYYTNTNILYKYQTVFKYQTGFKYQIIYNSKNIIQNCILPTNNTEYERRAIFNSNASQFIDIFIQIVYKIKKYSNSITFSECFLNNSKCLVIFKF